VRTIRKGNTRFAANPFPATGANGGTGAATYTNPLSTSTAASAGGGGGGGAGGAGDGSDSPKVNGYGFVVTPSPAPGVDIDPVMTWGMIEGTPFRLDAGGAADAGHFGGAAGSNTSGGSNLFHMPVRCSSPPWQPTPHSNHLLAAT
jgi:hypothetical protein